MQATLLAQVYHAMLLEELIFGNKSKAMLYQRSIQAMLG